MPLQNVLHHRNRLDKDKPQNRKRVSDANELMSDHRTVLDDVLKSPLSPKEPISIDCIITQRKNHKAQRAVLSEVAEECLALMGDDPEEENLRGLKLVRYVENKRRCAVNALKIRLDNATFVVPDQKKSVTH